MGRSPGDHFSLLSVTFNSHISITGMTPLHLAALKNADALKELCKFAIPKYGKEKVLEQRHMLGDTPLVFACSATQTPDTIAELLAAGADISSRNGFDVTALMNAALLGNDKIVEVLIKGGADVNAVAVGIYCCSPPRHFAKRQRD